MREGNKIFAGCTCQEALRRSVCILHRDLASVPVLPFGSLAAEISTSHLYWDPRYPDLKLLQAPWKHFEPSLGSSGTNLSAPM